MIFVCSVHDVGKIQYYKQLPYRAEKKYGMDFIMDGNICFLNDKGKISLVNEKIIKALKMDLLIVLIDKSTMIKERIEENGRFIWDEQFIKSFQKKEIEYARQLGRKLGIDYKIITSQIENGVKFGKSIILSIKPIYAEQIFSGEKKYEYRKRLCTENIDKIYLYATCPVKKIIGEVEVFEKCSMKKEKLWDLTYEYAGISDTVFFQYFQKESRANAYGLGNVLQYKVPVGLEEMGVNYVPQSYIYINTV